MDKSITFSVTYCGLLNFIFWKDNTNCIWFFAFQFFSKVGKFAAFTKRPKKQKCFSFRGLCPSDLLTRGSASRPQ